MGWGDEIMASGRAAAECLRSGRRVKVLDRRGRPRWHELWDGNPRIVRPSEPGHFATITDAPGARPYIDHHRSTDQRWAWREVGPPVSGEIFGVVPDPRALGRVLIEPSLKARASPNKLWRGWEAFAGLAKSAGLRLAQLCPPGQGALAVVERIETVSFRAACNALAAADGIVTHEGGLHHAAAALGRPAVVIFGGYISPRQTGYAAHANLFTGGEPCGWRVPCAHCLAAMRMIGPEMVAAEAMLMARKKEVA